jgi:acyl-CoA thioester hydrolase
LIVEGFEFRQSQQVRHADTDAQGHVFFGNYLVYFDEALGGYLRAVGPAWDELVSAGLDFVYVAAQCNFEASALAGDILNTYARVARVGNSSLTAEFVTQRAEDGQRMADGSLTAVLVETAGRRPTRVPDRFRQAIDRLEGGAAGENTHPG